jgi:hypothetical protein
LSAGSLTVQSACFEGLSEKPGAKPNQQYPAKVSFSVHKIITADGLKPTLELYVDIAYQTSRQCSKISNLRIFTLILYQSVVMVTSPPDLAM